MSTCRRIVLLLLAALLAVTGCSPDATPTDPAGTGGASAKAARERVVRPDGTIEIFGETGPGSLFYLARPTAWNGELVVYAHGFVQPFVPVALPAEDLVIETRERLLAAGFAIAYSSYSINGYAAKDGAQRTHQLSGLFAGAFDRPSRTYLVGVSLGGLIVEYLAERFPGQYDGALAISGALAGGQHHATYIADFRVLFDWFFPGVLPGSLYELPEGTFLTPGSATYLAVTAALAAEPAKAAALASIAQIDLQVVSPLEALTSFLIVLGYQVNNANDFADLLHGHGFYDNSQTWYTSPLLDPATTAALNAGVARYTADPAAANYLERWWEPTGEIGIPLLTLHTTRDPLIPLETEEIFRQLVADAGRQELLVQRTVERFGHSNFTAEELTAAFADLVLWVRAGISPSADGAGAHLPTSTTLATAASPRDSRRTK